MAARGKKFRAAVAKVDRTREYPIPDAVVLVHEIRKHAALRFAGLQAYHGKAQHLRTAKERREAIASIGASVFPHDGDAYETLLATADSRMYRDKTRRKRGTLEQERARRDQEPDRELDRIDRVDEPVGLDELEKLPVVVERGPRGERHPGGAQRHAGRRDQPDRGLDVGARVALLEVGENRVAQRFRGRDDERSAQARELGQVLAVAQQMLDLRGEVEGQTRELAVQRARDGQRVAGPIEKIGVAKGDVFGAHCHLAADVGKHHGHLHDAEFSLKLVKQFCQLRELLLAYASRRHERRRRNGG